MLTPYRQLAVAVAVVLCLLGAYAVGRSDGADLVQGRWDKAQLAAKVAHDAQVEVLTSERDALAAKLTATNDQHEKDLRNAQAETNRYRDRVATGAGGLRVAATCPGPTLGPQAAPGPGLDSRTGAELGPTARQAYFALRDGIDRAAAQLAACQDELKLRQ